MKVNYGCGQYTLKIFNDNGELCDEVKGRNIITDNYLQSIAYRMPQYLLCKLFIGKGARGSGASAWDYKTYLTSPATILATQVNDTITTTSPFFKAEMVGQTIHFENDNYANGSSYDCRITQFISNTQVRVNTQNQASAGKPNYQSRITVWNTGRYSLFEAHDDSSDNVNTSHLGTKWEPVDPKNVTVTQTTQGEIRSTTLRVVFTSTPANPTSIINSYIINEFGLTATNQTKDQLCIRVMLDADVTIARNQSFQIEYEMYIVEKAVLNNPSTFLSSDTFDYQINNTNPITLIPYDYVSHTSTSYFIPNSYPGTRFNIVSGLMPYLWSGQQGSLGDYTNLVLSLNGIAIINTNNFTRDWTFGDNQIWKLTMTQTQNLPAPSGNIQNFSVVLTFRGLDGSARNVDFNYTMYTATLSGAFARNNTFDYFDKNDPFIFELEWNRTFGSTPAP